MAPTAGSERGGGAGAASEQARPRGHAAGGPLAAARVRRRAPSLPCPPIPRSPPPRCTAHAGVGVAVPAPCPGPGAEGLRVPQGWEPKPRPQAFKGAGKMAKGRPAHLGHPFPSVRLPPRSQTQPGPGRRYNRPPAARPLNDWPGGCEGSGPRPVPQPGASRLGGRAAATDTRGSAAPSRP